MLGCRIGGDLTHCSGPSLCLGERRKHFANKAKLAQMKPDLIVTKLRQFEVLTGQGMPCLDPIG